MGCRVGWFPLSIEYDCYGLLNILFLIKSVFFFAFQTAFVHNLYKSINGSEWGGKDRQNVEINIRFLRTASLLLSSSSSFAISWLIFFRYAVGYFLECLAFWGVVSCLVFIIGCLFSTSSSSILLWSSSLTRICKKKPIPIQQNGSLKDEEIQFFLYADESGSLVFETLLESSWNMSYILEIFPFS